jgi:hypothetical protein
MTIDARTSAIEMIVARQEVRMIKCVLSIYPDRIRKGQTQLFIKKRVQTGTMRRRLLIHVTYEGNYIFVRKWKFPYVLVRGARRYQ